MQKSGSLTTPASGCGLQQTDAIKTAIRDWIAASARRRTMRDVFGYARTQHGLGRRAARRLLSDLIDTGRLRYTNHFGQNYIEGSYDRPVRIAGPLVLVPPGRRAKARSQDTPIILAAGAAFGDGSHATTRLAAAGMLQALARGTHENRPDPSRALDIGTGSGILALAALKMGIDLALGTDIDPCARHEARTNAAANDLERRLRICDCSLDDISGTFDLITANLRLPTLVSLVPQIIARTRPGGHIVLSGIRPWECRRLRDCTTSSANIGLLWQDCLNQWSAMVFVKQPERTGRSQ